MGVRNRFLIFTFLFLIFTGSITAALFLFHEEDSYALTIDGLAQHQNASVTVSDQDGKIIKTQEKLDNQRLEIRWQKHEKGKTYTIETRFLENQKGKNPVFIQQHIYPETGKMVLAAQGLSTNSGFLKHEEIKGEKGENQKIYPDWNGRVEVSSSLKAECFDLGGMRGGTISFCHKQPKKPLLQNVQFLSANGVNFSELARTLIQGSFQLMTEQLTVVGLQQVQTVGKFFDAKHQMETQRLFQTLHARAHKDYHPSEQVCTIGTNIQNLAKSDLNTALGKEVINKKIIQKELLSGDAAPSNTGGNKAGRLKAFIENFCQPMDSGKGLEAICANPADPRTQNKDIDFVKTVFTPLTIDVDLNDETDPENVNQKHALFTLLDYLYNNDTKAPVAEAALKSDSAQEAYLRYRSLIAMRGVARDTAGNIIAMKLASPENIGTDGRERKDITPYTMAIMKDLGMRDDEIRTLIGERPSYYAQMELLTKTLYQNQDFYTNLYDKPANVKRLSTALDAIKSIQDRDMYQSRLRQKMLSSMILEMKLREEQRLLEAEPQQ